MKQTYNEALSHFDTLPDSANVRLPVVQGLFSCSPMTVWRMTKDGRIPAARKLSARLTVWNVGELRKALADFQQRG
jgi:predicted DNA-binding transcriptional regulator AlpA